MQFGEMSVEPVGEREVRVTRKFNAPRALVWRALTEPDLLKRWLGVMGGWSLAECTLEPKVGGKYRYLWRNTNGQVMGMGGTITEFSPPHRMASTEKFDEAWYEGDAGGVQELTEANGVTTLTLTMRYASKKVRDDVLAGPAWGGLSANYDQLASVLGTFAAEGR